MTNDNFYEKINKLAKKCFDEESEKHQEFFMDLIKNIEIKDHSSAEFKYEKLVEQIKNFQDSLSEEYDMCVLLPAYIREKILVTHISYQNPDLLYFYGFYDNKKVQIIQHISQLNFMLIALQKTDQTKQPNRIGFVINRQEE